MYVKNFAHLMELSREKKSKKIAVVAADDNEVLEVVAKAEENGLAEFILIGDKAKIEKLISKRFEVEIRNYR